MTYWTLVNSFVVTKLPVAKSVFLLKALRDGCHIISYQLACYKIFLVGHPHRRSTNVSQKKLRFSFWYHTLPYESYFLQFLFYWLFSPFNDCITMEMIYWCPLISALQGLRGANGEVGSTGPPVRNILILHVWRRFSHAQWNYVGSHAINEKA